MDVPSDLSPSAIRSLMLDDKFKQLDDLSQKVVVVVVVKQQNKIFTPFPEMTGTEGPPHREMAAGLIPAVAELLRSLILSQHWLEKPANVPFQSAFWLHQWFLSPSFLIFFPPFSSVSQAKVC